MTFGQRRRSPRPFLALVPMAALAFNVLFCFVLATGLAQGPRIDIALPSAATGESASTPAGVVVTVGAQGDYTVDGAAITADELGRAVAQRVIDRRVATVVVGADARAPWERVVYALDTTRQYGIPEVSLAVREPRR